MTATQNGSEINKTSLSNSCLINKIKVQKLTTYNQISRQKSPLKFQTTILQD